MTPDPGFCNLQIPAAVYTTLLLESYRDDPWDFSMVEPVAPPLGLRIQGSQTSLKGVSETRWITLFLVHDILRDAEVGQLSPVIHSLDCTIGALMPIRYTTHMVVTVIRFGQQV